MGFCLQNENFPAKLHNKFKTNNNNHPKPITNNNTIMQQHHNSKKSLNASTKAASKGWDHLPGRRLPNDRKKMGTTANGRSERWKNTGTGATTNGGSEEEQATTVKHQKRKTNTRVGRRRRRSKWEEDEDETVSYERNVANAQYGRLTFGFYSNRVNGILDFSPWVLGAQSNTPDISGPYPPVKG